MFKKRIEFIQNYLKKYNIDGYLVFMADDHGSEYTPLHYKSIAAISGFTGSAGFLLVLKDKSLLWTDGRYFLQASIQLKQSNTELMKMGQDCPLTDYLAKLRSVAFDFKCASVSFIKELKAKSPMIRLIDEADIIDKIWQDRSPLPLDKLWAPDEKVCLHSPLYKLEKTLSKIRCKKNYGTVISNLADIAYLLNLRGNDITYNPVFVSFMFLTRINGKNNYYLFINEKKLTTRIENFLKSNKIKILPYNDIYKMVSNFKGIVYFDPSNTNYKLYSLMKHRRETILYPTLSKAIKSNIDIKQTKKVHVKDGTAMCKLIYYIKKNVGKKYLDELTVADYLENLRRKQGAYDLSFGTICGYQSNGAIIHYSATKETNKEIKKEGLLLIDSGGQYKYGTTDITRTLALGNITDKMKFHFTLVLKAHIDLAMQVFNKDMTDYELDLITRKCIREHGLDYNHGTGHGVGHVLNVHEGPQSISPKNKEHPVKMKKGMITSDEPGLYFEGEYGIRHENEILCVRKDNTHLGFEPITYVPFDLDAVDKTMLDDAEKQWLNDYHKLVYKKISRHLNSYERKYLRKMTRKI